MIKIIIKTFLILFLFSNVLVKANDISAMGGISDAAGGAAQAAADQLSSDAGKVAENIARCINISSRNCNEICTRKFS